MKSWMKGVATLALATGIAGMLVYPASAQKKFKNKLVDIYHLSPETTKCKVCHAIPVAKEGEKKQGPSKKNLNAYGKELQADANFAPAKDKDDDHEFTEAELTAVEKAIKNIENKDSDGDGVSNVEELNLGTNPGDAKDTPAADKVEAYRKEHKK